MDLEEASFFDTVMDVVARYGMKRATMADLARATGVSRQTLYDRFGDKDGVMAAVIAHMTATIDRELRAAFGRCATLEEKLDVFFEIAVWPTYNALQTMPDAADFERGMAAASTQASLKASETKRALLTDMLRPHLKAEADTADDVAAFIEQSSGRAKMSNMPRNELERFLSVLKASVIALARTG